MKFMLDTNICIYIIKKNPGNILKKFLSLSPDDICISSVTLAELRFGVQKSQHIEQNQRALDRFILPLQILPFDEMAADHYGKIRHHLEKRGVPIGPLDLMIAAHAESTHKTLVTNNVKEFSRIPKLKIQNWILDT